MKNADGRVLFYPSKIKIDLNQFLILGVRVHIK